MRDLFDEDREVEEQDELKRSEAFEELQRVEKEAELVEHPSWMLFKERLQSIERGDTESLIFGDEVDSASARARIKLARHLLGLEKELRSRAAELRAKMTPEDDEE